MYISGVTATGNPAVAIQVYERLLSHLIDVSRLGFVPQLALLMKKTGPRQKSWMMGSESTFQGFGPGAGSLSVVIFVARMQAGRPAGIEGAPQRSTVTVVR